MVPTKRNTQVINSREAASASFMSRVYFWMMAGVLMSGVTAFIVASNAKLMTYLMQSQGIFIGLIILQVAAVVALSAAVQRMSVAVASAVYALYATLVGVTFSTIFLVYTLPSISLTFFSTACAFGGLAIYGTTTKRDLGPVGSFCLMGLFGMIAIMLLSFFFPSLNSSSMQLTVSVIGVLVFSGLTAYDSQRVKALQYQYLSEDEARKGSIVGALILYLDFINLFLSLLRLMGDRR